MYYFILKLISGSDGRFPFYNVTARGEFSLSPNWKSLMIILYRSVTLFLIDLEVTNIT